MIDCIFADISSWQPAHVDMKAYKQFSEQNGCKSRIVLRVSEGVGVKDQHFENYWQACIEAGIEEIYLYHYAYPNLNPDATKEAEWFLECVGDKYKQAAGLMLDLEQNESKLWAIAFGEHVQEKINRFIYDSYSHIKEYLADERVAELFELVIADWTFNPDIRPGPIPPWKNIAWLQFSDRGHVGGIGGFVDVNVFISGETVPPPQPPIEHTYVIASGDTLWAIAQKLHVDEYALCMQNHTHLNKTAIEHGFSSCDMPGSRCHWIFPGDTLSY